MEYDISEQNGLSRFYVTYHHTHSHAFIQTPLFFYVDSYDVMKSISARHITFSCEFHIPYPCQRSVKFCRNYNLKLFQWKIKAWYQINHNVRLSNITGPWMIVLGGNFVMQLGPSLTDYGADFTGVNSNYFGAKCLM